MLIQPLSVCVLVSTQSIYAVGDCCTKYQFTHAADFMARIVIRNALFFGEFLPGGREWVQL